MLRRLLHIIEITVRPEWQSFPKENVDMPQAPPSGCRCRAWSSDLDRYDNDFLFLNRIRANIYRNLGSTQRTDD